jgi:PAS domain S-box-containing protein
MAERVVTDALAETLDCFEAGRPRGTTEIAEALDLGRRATYDRLERLVELDRLETKTVGANARVWWRPPGTATEERPQRTLGEGRPFLESVLDTQQDLVYAFDTDGSFLRWNERVPEVTGYTPEELERMGPLDFLADRATEEAAAAIERLLEGGTATVECPLVTADGTEIPYEFTGGTVTDDAGEIVGFTGIGRDVSDRKARERRLQGQRDDMRAELEDVFARIDEAFLAVEDDWRLTYVNERAVDLCGSTAGALLGTRIWDVFPDLEEIAIRARLEDALTAQESVEFEGYAPGLDRWLEVRGYPSETGLSIYVHDVTERKAREREVEESRRRYRTLVENVPNGAVTLVDRDLSYRTVGGHTIEGVDATLEDIEGSYIADALPTELADVLLPAYEAALGGEPREFESEIGGRCYQFHVLPVRNDAGEVFAAMGMSQDVTDRKERERELQRYETIVDTVGDGVYALDEDGCFLDVNKAYVELTGYDREELLGTPGSRVVSEADAPDFVDRFSRLGPDDDSAVLEADVQRADGSQVPVETRMSAFHADGGRSVVVGIARDVSERVARERELRDRIDQQGTITHLSQLALEGADVDVLLAEAVDVVTDTLDAEYGKVLELDADEEELQLREGVGWDEAIVGDGRVSAVEETSQAAYTLEDDRPIVVDDLSTDWRFSGPGLLREHDVHSGITTIVGPSDDPWGILGVHATDTDVFSTQDATFLHAVANVLAAAIERHHHERTLVRQREQLVALNSLGEVVRDVTDAVIEHSTRREIETAVCDRLTETDSYRSAWIGTVDATALTTTVRSDAGVEECEDRTDGVDRSVTPPEAALEAFRTGEVRVETGRDDRGDRERSSEEESTAVAAIPITHSDTVYSVLAVTAARQNAFVAREREMLAQLGTIVGHAIAAAERKRALMSDELVELDLQATNVFTPLDLPSGFEGTLTLEDTVPVEDGGYLVYGTATADALDAAREVVEHCHYWDAIAVRSDGPPYRFELQMTDPPVISAVAARGGYIDQARIEDGDLRMTIHLAPTVDVRRVVAVIEEAYHHAELLGRRQVTRDRDDPRRLQAHLVGTLTDRQRSVLEAAYHAGFFEWPRDTTGEEVAESIGVAAPTFHQHLRKAEQKIFDQVVAGSR